ncbi:MAG: ATP-binding protein [Humidesulfovibrio sp.]|jgi:anti-sigma regulatory factor (Ser/Thr protein kinase)|uniref:ATP-binding protein n=1 Tax=Humidesulfovibrio sp. TaxID=2910988 RepID=UPI0027337CC2|nr:ATP-binding protein [Humidesulfovibrio sp.]MDP2849396.1 ATP-binding protein [Humidesulfovibrio sp.]
MSLLRLPASEDSLPQFRQFALDGATCAGLDLAAQQRVELVLEEALINVIRHAYSGMGPDVAHQIELACGPDADGVFRLVLTDWGAAFDPVGATQAAQPSDDAPADQDDDLLSRLESNLEADLEHRALGGMGLFLIRTMSQPAYARQGQANVLTLRFPPTTED